MVCTLVLVHTQIKHKTCISMDCPAYWVDRWNSQPRFAKELPMKDPHFKVNCMTDWNRCRRRHHRCWRWRRRRRYKRQFSFCLLLQNDHFAAIKNQYKRRRRRRRRRRQTGWWWWGGGGKGRPFIPLQTTIGAFVEGRNDGRDTFILNIST